MSASWDTTLSSPDYRLALWDGFKIISDEQLTKDPEAHRGKSWLKAVRPEAGKTHLREGKPRRISNEGWYNHLFDAF